MNIKHAEDYIEAMPSPGEVKDLLQRFTTYSIYDARVKHAMAKYQVSEERAHEILLDEYCRDLEKHLTQCDTL